MKWISILSRRILTIIWGTIERLGVSAGPDCFGSRVNSICYEFLRFWPGLIKRLFQCTTGRVSVMYRQAAQSPPGFL